MFLHVQSQKPSSAMMKLALMRTATGKEDPKLPLLQRISSLVTSLRNPQLTAPQIAPHRVQVADASQHQLFRGDCVNQAFMVKLPLLKDTNNKKRLAWAKKHEQLTLDRWKSVIWSDESKFEIFGSNRRVFVRRREGERMISACVVPTMKHGGGGVMVWGCFAGDTVELFRIQSTLNQHGYHSILQ
uniref:Transposase Tc1-like domain-containing protein n=1 Tax=Oncorhynchus tshawytscha TaxID=74940 RepID=A0AAZ3R0L5_ONCTS